MIEYLIGNLQSIEVNYIVIEVQGIAYRIISANPFRWQELLHQNIKVYCELVVREDSMTLYGFMTPEEKSLFNQLNRVSGIGPKSAMAITGSAPTADIISAIDQENSQFLTKFPGVGKKTAQQMILDLKGKITHIDMDAGASSRQGVSDNTIHDDIIEALKNLGYSQREVTYVEKTLSKESFTSTQEGLSMAFKLLLNK